MKINFFNKTKIKPWEYEKLIKNVFKQLNDKREFNIIFVDFAEIQRINREFRKLDKVTDVISFALCDDPDYDNDHELGDIFICLDQAFKQASDYGHSVTREVAFLAVHGYLHLCGYDHQTEEEENEMFTRQEQILEKAGITRNV